MRSLLALCAFSFLAGCSIRQQFTPVELASAEGMPSAFTETYLGALQAKGLPIETLTEQLFPSLASTMPICANLQRAAH
ncbi:hypothetical protein [Pseudomonas chlororaphis]|uniref:hypothetical protein n=1 Tax=Pseudomonas chlororaphis TaxID=587753 RepID=UPI001B305335|nr:hypothetical protein [Pseudomonas chlororaphis]MBP5072466.1 hypothetical protein [Pseudomonas chlororaphis]QTT88356.1 hypothetical protein HUT28_13545 [Pseudomonas chlororaphis]